MNPPRIAITNDTRIMRCRLLVRLIELAGGKPVLIPIHLRPKPAGTPRPKGTKRNALSAQDYIKAKEEHLANVRKKLDSCDGMLLPGNRFDVPPTAYNAPSIHPQTARRLPSSPMNIRFDVEQYMVHYVTQERPLPVLGICGGMQVANVVLGGSLVQHLPDDPRVKAGGISHVEPALKKMGKDRQEAWAVDFDSHIMTGSPRNIFPGTHPMTVWEDSLLGATYRELNPKIDLTTPAELSIHHQGCFEENLADALRMVAQAPDGVVEAVDMPSHPHLFLLCQFHWECNVTGLALPLVKKLVEAADSLN